MNADGSDQQRVMPIPLTEYVPTWARSADHGTATTEPGRRLSPPRDLTERDHRSDPVARSASRVPARESLLDSEGAQRKGAERLPSSWCNLACSILSAAPT